jgi:hypothetical protein
MNSHTSLLAAVAQVVACLPAAPETSSNADEHLARRHTATRRPLVCGKRKPQSDLNLLSSSRRLSLESTPSKSPSKSHPARRYEAPGTITSDLHPLRTASCPLRLGVKMTLLPIM